MRANLSKAKIVSHDKTGIKEISVLFDPNQYSIDKSTAFAPIGKPGRDTQLLQFVKGEAATLTIDLFLDTTETGEDVRTLIDEISELMKNDKALHAPPVCSFHWGGPVFSGIIERISKRFTLFNRDDVPVRATIGVTFRQHMREEKIPKHAHTNEEDIPKSIISILTTATGERVMKPDLGCDIHRYIFAPINSTTSTLLETAIREELSRWEPRIKVNKVSVRLEEGSVGKLLIQIDYTIKATNNQFNLVYPIYLS